jgi:hypothetical protein
MATVINSKEPRTPLQAVEQILKSFASENLNTTDLLSPVLRRYAEAILSYLAIAKREWANDPVSGLFSKSNTYQQDRFIAVALLRLLGVNAAAFGNAR